MTPFNVGAARSNFKHTVLRCESTNFNYSHNGIYSANFTAHLLERLCKDITNVANELRQPNLQIKSILYMAQKY